MTNKYSQNLKTKGDEIIFKITQHSATNFLLKPWRDILYKFRALKLLVHKISNIIILKSSIVTPRSWRKKSSCSLDDFTRSTIIDLKYLNSGLKFKFQSTYLSSHQVNNFTLESTTCRVKAKTMLYYNYIHLVTALG